MLEGERVDRQGRHVGRRRRDEEAGGLHVLERCEGGGHFRGRVERTEAGDRIEGGELRGGGSSVGGGSRVGDDPRDDAGVRASDRRLADKDGSRLSAFQRRAL